MLFASMELAARIERAEVELMVSAVKSVGRSHPARDVMARPIAGGAARYSGEGSPLNKVAGLGFGGLIDAVELDAFEAEYAARGCAVQVELSSLADPSVAPLLTARGYRLVGFENVLGRDLTPGVSARVASDDGPAIAVDRATDLELWLDTVVTAFSSPDDAGVPSHESFAREALEAVVRDMAGADGFVRYLARMNGEAAGGASMRIGDGVAQLCGAATLPAWRRKGVQGALLAHRLAEAIDADCDVAVVTTQPGSTSQKNVQRNGFELLYTRAVLILDSPDRVAAKRRIGSSTFNARTADRDPARRIHG